MRQSGSVAGEPGGANGSQIAAVGTAEGIRCGAARPIDIARVVDAVAAAINVADDIGAANGQPG